MIVISGEHRGFPFGGSLVVPWSSEQGVAMYDRRITKRLVDSLKPTGCDRFVWDDTLIDFGVRVQLTGTKSYVVKYRAGSGIRGA